nr:response regulator [uncultured Anaerostipes sp.]
MKYTSSGGSVKVSVDELPCDEAGYMMVRTRVSDTGIGMSQEYLTNIFEAFTREQNTTKSKIAGTGSEILEGRNILLAEDNDLNAEIAEAILESVGLKIERVEDGIQCVNRIEKMPANAFEEDKRDAIAAGMNGHIAKPIQVDKMLSILSEVIRQRENY